MKQMWQRTAVGLIAAAVATTVAAREFRNSDVHPADYPTVMAVNYMSDIISKKTNGKHTIKTFVGGTLGSEKDTIEQTKLGALDLVRINVAPMNNIVPRDDGADHAVPVPVEGAHAQGARRPDRRRDPQGRESQGFIGLAFYDSRRALALHGQEADQDAGRRQGHEDPRPAVATCGSRCCSAMGANATPMPYGEVYTALKIGTVDAAENNFPSFDTAPASRSPRYYSKTEHSMAPEMLLMSQEGLGHAAAGRAEDLPRRGQGIGAVHAQAVGREGSEVAGGGARRRRAGRSRSTRSRSRTRWARCTTSSSRRRS